MAIDDHPMLQKAIDDHFITLLPFHGHRWSFYGY